MYCDWPVLRRCCFFVPLRRGVLAFAYLNVLYSGFMVGIYSFAVHISLASEMVYHGMMFLMPAELCIVIYLLEIGFTSLLIYGAHTKIRKPLIMYYYFGISTTLASTLMGILEVVQLKHFYAEAVLLAFTGLCVQVYQLILVWSLIKKMDEDGSHAYENQLHQVINSQPKANTNGVYNPITIPNQAEIV